MATEVIDPPVKPDVTPTTKVGEKFSDILARVDKGIVEQPKVEPEPKKDETPLDKETAPVKEDAKAVDTKPTSPLQAVTRESKPKEDYDVKRELEELDKVKNPTPDHWARARKARSFLAEEVETLKAAPKVEPVSLDPIIKERDELKSKVTDQEQRLKAINAEYSDEFQTLLKDKEKVLTKIGNKMKYAEPRRLDDGTVVSASENAAALIDALNLPEGKFKTQQIKEALDGLEPDDKTAIRVLIEHLDEADEKITDFRKDLPAKWDALQAQREKQQLESEHENLKNLETQFGKVAEELPKEIPTVRKVPSDVEGAEEWNRGIDEDVAAGLAALKPNGADFKKTTEISILGHRYRRMEKLLIAKDQELTEANARLKKFDESSPDFRGGKKPPSGEKPNKSYSQILAEVKAAGEE
jgi:formate dehydrogenase maturation protein FdhE